MVQEFLHPLVKAGRVGRGGRARGRGDGGSVGRRRGNRYGNAGSTIKPRVGIIGDDRRRHGPTDLVRDDGMIEVGQHEPISTRAFDPTPALLLTATVG